MAKQPTKKSAVKKTTTKKATVKKTADKKTVAKKAAQTKKAAPAKKAVATEVSTKKAVTKKAAPVKKAAPQKAFKPKAVAPAAATPVTTLIAKCDVGFGRSLFLRGEGPGLSWESGVEMANISADEWSWSSSQVAHAVEVKVLIDDTDWATGANVSLIPGEKTTIEPVFA